MKVIIIDPPYDVLNNGKLFQSESYQDPAMAEPFVRLVDYCQAKGVEVKTIDCLSYYINKSAKIWILSFGNLKSIRRYIDSQEIKLSALLAVEPPMINPEIYAAVTELEKYFDRLYLYNDSFLKNKKKYSQLLFFQPKITQSEALYFSSKIQRLKRYVIIASNLRPRKSSYEELYSRRIIVMLHLARHNVVDLYGKGWLKLLGRNYLNLIYLLNYFKIKKIYKGSCISKCEVLSRYEFSIVFENMIMEGYLTEKIFDAMRAGCIPIYLGAPDINKYIPSGCFIDYRNFKSIDELNKYCMSLTDVEILNYRACIFNYLANNFGKYENSLIDVCDKIMADC